MESIVVDPASVGLGSPLMLRCGAVLPNRIAKAALTEGLADLRNDATARHVALYRRWADGGAGLILTGNVQVDRRFLERPGNIAFGDRPPDCVAHGALAAYAEAGSARGNVCWMQLNHPGRQTPSHVHAHPLAPSAVALALPGFGQPVAMSHVEILETIARFADAAGHARKAGFGGVQIHAAHGYLISQFLSPRSNVRDDEWGGTIENRARFLLAVVRAVRAEVGPAFAVGVKLNSADFQQGGFTNDDCLLVVRWLEEAGIDLLEISGGTYEQPQMVVAGRSRAGDPLLEPIRLSTQTREAYFLTYAEAIRRATRTPLMVTGGFRTRAAMENALGAGLLDVVGLGRPLIVNPAAPAKLIEGRIDSLSSYENTLSMPVPGTTAESTVASVKHWGIQSWFCVQLLRLGQGLDPDLDLSVSDALAIYRANEVQALAALQGRTPL